MPTITGTDGNDTLAGLSGYDQILGLGGDDVLTISSGGPYALIDGGAGDDTVTLQNVTVAAGSLLGGAGTDLLYVRAGLTLTGASFSAASSGFEKIQFLNLDDSNYSPHIFADDGDNVFDFSGFTLVGTSGVAINSGDGNDTITGTMGNDNLGAGYYTSNDRGNKLLSGLGGNDSLSGGSGNDTLIGGAGDDTLDGSGGIDVAVFSGNYADYTFFKVNSYTYKVSGGADGTDTLRNIPKLQFADQTVLLALVPLTGLTLVGTSGNDTFTGSAGPDTISGLGGNDALFGNGGADTLDGGDGNDLLRDGTLLIGGNGNDELHDGATMQGGAGNDTIFAATYSGSITIDGGDGDDVVRLGSGSNNFGTVILTDGSISGGAGIDLLSIDAVASVTGTFRAASTGCEKISLYGLIDGSTSADTIDLSGVELVPQASPFGVAGAWINGESGNDTITGTGANDLLLGGDGGDVINGMGGDDTIEGGYGTNTIDGGAGTDIARYSFNRASVTITANGDGSFTMLGSGWRDTLWNVELAAFGDQTICLGEDYASGTSTNGAISSNSALTGTIEKAGDTDWFKTTLFVGFSYEFDLQGSASGNGTLANPYLQLLDASGNPVVSNDDASGGTRDSHITFTPTAGGTYFLVASSAAASGTGTYRIAMGTPKGTAGDDYVSVSGGTNSFDLSQGGHDIFYGGDGNDTIFIGAALDPLDTLNGSWGTDRLVLDGDYSAGVTLSPSTIRNFETITLTGGHTYNLTLNMSDPFYWSAYGSATTVDGASLGASDAMIIDGSAVSTTVYRGGAGNDSLTGGSSGDTLYGNGGNDTLSGHDGADLVSGGIGDDVLDGGAGNDSLDGGAGNDTLTGGLGDDMLDGAGGTDTVAFSGTRAQYSLITVGSGSFVVGADGVDYIKNVEYLQFKDQTIAYVATPTPGVLVVDGNSGGNNVFSANALIAFASGSASNSSSTGFQMSGIPYFGTITVTGTGFTYASGKPVGGTITGFSDSTGEVWTGLSAPVSQLWDAAMNGTSDSFHNLFFSGNDTFVCSSPTSAYSGFDGNDTFYISHAFNMGVYGGNGDDTFNIFGTLSGILGIDGGAGNDTLNIYGDYSGNLDLGWVESLETINLGTGYSYKLTPYNGHVSPSGDRQTINGSALGASDKLVVDNHDMVSIALSISGGAGTDSLGGGSGADTLTGGAGNDTLRGYTGNDVITGGLGDDLIDGGAGSDQANFSGASTAYTITYGSGGDVTVVGADGTDRLTGIETLVFADKQIAVPVPSTTGGAGDDILTGGSGNDNLQGLGGNDTLIGGPGDDTLDGGAGLDTADYSSDTEGISVDLASGTATGSLIGHDTLIGIERVVGGSGNDSIAGNNATETLVGGAGDDRLYGRDGDDYYDLSGGGSDWTQAMTGNQTFYMGAAWDANDVIDGHGYGTDVLIAEGNTNVDNPHVNVPRIELRGPYDYHLTGSFGNVQIDAHTVDTAHTVLIDITGSSDQSVIGGAGTDTIRTGSGNDTLSGGLGTNTLNGGAGTDTAVLAGRASDYLVTSNGDGSTTVTGAGENDTLINIEKVTFGGGQTLTLAEFQAQAFSPLQALEYIASYKDLMGAFGDDAVWGARHYFNNGKAEGRTISFNALNYLCSYGDLIVAFHDDQLAATEHYLKNGSYEGRKVTFDPLAYVCSYSDLLIAFHNDKTAAAEHYIRNGYWENRKVTFDALAYVCSYDDLVIAFHNDKTAAEEHYIRNGYWEGRKVTFNALAYIASYTDLIGAFGDDVQAAEEHYIRNGFWEGRKVTFDPVAYLINNTDLGTCGFTATDATEHYLKNGYWEHRTTNGAFGSEQTNHDLTVGGSVSDTIGTSGDKDWFAVNVTAGQTYTFTLSGVDGGNGTLADPFLAICDARGVQLTYANDSTNHDAVIRFTALSTGTCYLVASANNSGTGSYKLFATAGG
ncbi:beta strand repeat-containing protein [Rhizomicrobium electricum]|uniref:Peptidase C-terminal archaeal/bacterial domain-containing protein n=1 Tax=Rhizomicrobium electricum TaxID=480070 RepID=A0ABP3PHE6_9PROT|nr:calcium-binding protein [Rhizomicrobium electricum]NIJ48234.1 Ca2+-binding RTX toxin-like protein [Rhizomicrobium electricum]